MVCTTDDNPSAENFAFEQKQKLVNSVVNNALCPKLPSNNTLRELTQEGEDEEETNHKNSEIGSKSSNSQQECGTILERKMTKQLSTERQDDNRQASNGLLPSKTDACEQKTAALDGGWGWMVLGGCVYCTIMLTSIGMCFSIEFGQLMKSFGMSATAISWAFNMHAFTWSLTMPVTAPLCNSLGWRKVGLCFSFIAALSYIALAFAFSPAYIFFFFSFLFSAAVGVTQNISLLILPAYFEKHRGLALGLNITGVAIGQMVMPQVVTLLQAEFGYRGATLIHAGLFLNVCVATALFRPLEKCPRKVDKVPTKHPPPATKEISLIQELNKKEFLLGVSTQSLNAIPIGKNNDTIKKSPEGTSILRQILDGIACNIKSSAASLKSFTVLIYATSFSFFVLGYVNFIMIIPFAILGEGHSLQSAAWCMSGAAISNFFSRLIMAFLADRTWFSIKWTYMAGSVIASVFCFSFAFALPSVTWLMVCMAGWGAGLGIIMGLWVMLLIETVGLDRYVLAMGANSLVMSVSYVTAGPIFGVIRDASSTYAGSLIACAALQLSTALLWLLMPCAQRADQRRETRREKEAEKDML